MKSSNREEIVDHNAKELFDIVLDIESYPYFIPWCSAMKVHSKNDNEIYADMIVCINILCHKNLAHMYNLIKKS